MPNANSYAAKVYQALPDEDNPIPYVDLVAKLDWPLSAQLRFALEDLITEGVAKITYGRGWHKVKREFTVIGLIDDDSGAILVAGVVEGAPKVLDFDQSEGYTRYAESYWAHNAYDAEQLAVGAINNEGEDDDDQ